MLKNTSDKEFTIQWGGIAYTLSPGSIVDIEKLYNVKDKELYALEDRFINKFAGKLERFMPEVGLDMSAVEKAPEKLLDWSKTATPKPRGRPRKG